MICNRLFSMVMIASISATATALSFGADQLDGLPLIFADDFEQGADRWAPTDPKAWKITEMDRQGKVYDQHRQSNYKPTHRSPSNLSLLKDIVVGDFVLLVKARSTAVKAGGHRDCCIFFGYQDDEHFYYAHQGLVRDAISNQLLKVDKGPRKSIGQTNAGSAWDDGWHQIKLVRRVKEGTIELYFDDMKKPAKTAVDKDFAWGLIGLGCFGETVQWDDVKLYGREVKPPAK
jgi:hypothetical protein